MTLEAEQVLSAIPDRLREPLLRTYNEVVSNFRSLRWEPSELNGGKFCEVVHSILRGYVDGSYPKRPTKPKNMVDACKKFEAADAKQFPRSVRVQIPRMIVALYEVRNNRGVGHVGGDVDPNHMDAIAVMSMVKWIMAELVRIFHDVDTETATEIVDALVERDVPVVWAVASRRRVLAENLSMRDKTLLLLYSSSAPLRETDLVTFIEHSNASVYRRDVLRRAHKARLIEYDGETGLVHLSPLGSRYVEEHLPLTV